MKIYIAGTRWNVRDAIKLGFEHLEREKLIYYLNVDSAVHHFEDYKDMDTEQPDFIKGECGGETTKKGEMDLV